MSASSDTENTQRVPLPAPGAFKFGMSQYIEQYPNGHFLRIIEWFLMEFRSDYKKVSSIFNQMASQHKIVNALAEMDDSSQYVNEISALLTSFYYVKSMVSDFKNEIDKMITYIDNLKYKRYPGNISDWKVHNIDVNGVNPLLEQYAVYERKQAIETGLIFLSSLFDCAFGLQNTAFVDLFKDCKFWFNWPVGATENDDSSLKFDPAFYAELPTTPCLHWRHDQFSLFACSCEYFKSRGEIHCHYVFLPKSEPKYFTLLNDYNHDLSSMDFESFLLQTQAMGWLDLAYVKDMECCVPFAKPFMKSFKALLYSMSVTKSLTYKLLCSPCPIFEYQKAFWNYIWQNLSMFNDDLNADPGDILHVFLKYGTKTYFDAEFFSKKYLNEYLSLELAYENVYEHSLRFLREKTTSSAKDYDFANDVNKARTLLTVAYLYTKATNSPLDLESFASNCQSNGLTTLDRWINSYTEEDIKKFVLKVQQVLQQSTPLKKQHSDNAHD